MLFVKINICLCVLLNSKDKPIDFFPHFTGAETLLSGWVTEQLSLWNYKLLERERWINNDGGCLSLTSSVLCQGHKEKILTIGKIAPSVGSVLWSSESCIPIHCGFKSVILKRKRMYRYSVSTKLSGHFKVIFKI